MTEALLTTKLHIPGLRTQLIHRTTLIEVLEARDLPNLTLISAPAGY